MVAIYRELHCDKFFRAAQRQAALETLNLAFILESSGFGMDPSNGQEVRNRRNTCVRQISPRLGRGFGRHSGLPGNCPMGMQNGGAIPPFCASGIILSQHQKYCRPLVEGRAVACRKIRSPFACRLCPDRLFWQAEICRDAHEGIAVTGRDERLQQCAVSVRRFDKQLRLFFLA